MGAGRNSAPTPALMGGERCEAEGVELDEPVESEEEELLVDVVPTRSARLE